MADVQKPTIIKKLPKSLVQFEVVIHDDVIAKWKELALNRLSQKTKIEGFRAGKIPLKLIAEHYGEDYIKAYTIDTAFPSLYAEVVKNEKLKVISQPDIKEIKGNPLTIQVTVPVLPELKLKDYHKIKVPKKDIKIKDKDVQAVLENFQNKQATFKMKKAEDKAQMGDRVIIDFQGFLEEGVTNDKLSSKNHPVILGSKSLITGFEEKIVGLKMGDEKEFKIVFPKEYHAREMQGKKVTFKVKVKELEERKLPEINEVLIEKVTGQKKSIKEFKEDVRKNLKIQMENDQAVERERKVLDELVDKIEVDLPEILIKEEVDHMVNDLKHRLKHQKMNLDDYLKHFKKTRAKLETEFAKEASKRVRLRMGIQEVIKAEKLEASEQDIQKEVDLIIKRSPDKNKLEITKQYEKGSGDYRQLANKIEVDKVMEKLLDIAA